MQDAIMHHNDRCGVLRRVHEEETHMVVTSENSEYKGMLGASITHHTRSRDNICKWCKDKETRKRQ